MSETRMRDTTVDNSLTRREAAVKGARNTGKRARISRSPNFGLPQPASVGFNVMVRLDLTEMTGYLSATQIIAVMNGIATVLSATCNNEPI